MKQSTRSIASFLATAVLSSCGGGGSAPAPAEVAPAPVTAVPIADVTPRPSAFSNFYQPLQTAVSTTTYSGRDLEEFTTLNRLRTKCGFSALVSNESLRGAVADHAKCIDSNNNRVLAAGLSLHALRTQRPTSL